MSAPAWMVGASLLFSLMGVCVKLASTQYGAGEMVMYRALVGLPLMAAMMRWRGVSWRTSRPRMHLSRSVSGSVALCLWFVAIGGLPLATAMTLNYMSAVWMAVFLMLGVLWSGRGGNEAAARLDVPLVAAIAIGFLGVALVLRPTLAQDQLGHGLLGLGSGMLAAVAYLQVSAMGRLGEPGERVVFYFSLSGVLAGALLALLTGGFHAHDARGLALLLAIGLLATGAQWMMTRAYAIGATLGIASLQYLGIVFSVLLGFLLFDDKVSAIAILGMVLIVAAGVWANFLRSRVATVQR